MNYDKQIEKMREYMKSHEDDFAKWLEDNYTLSELYNMKTLDKWLLTFEFCAANGAV